MSSAGSSASPKPLTGISDEATLPPSRRNRKKHAMPVEISLQTKLRPQLLMTPKLQQAIHLLLCSRQELVNETVRQLKELSADK